MIPNAASESPHCTLKVGYQGRIEAKAAPLVANISATPVGLRRGKAGMRPGYRQGVGVGPLFHGRLKHPQK